MRVIGKEKNYKKTQQRGFNKCRGLMAYDHVHVRLIFTITNSYSIDRIFLNGCKVDKLPCLNNLLTQHPIGIDWEV